MTTVSSSGTLNVKFNVVTKVLLLLPLCLAFCRIHLVFPARCKHSLAASTARVNGVVMPSSLAAIQQTRSCVLA